MAGQSKSDVLREIKDAFGLVPSWVESMPETALGGFWALMRDFYMAQTAIPNKYKELIGIAVSGATRCKYCQLFHVEGAKLNGATDAEIAEAATMAGVTMMGSTFLNAMGVDYEAFEKETMQIVANAKAQMAAQASAAAS
jgi:AhpD family alkylhydroperoxidase